MDSIPLTQTSSNPKQQQRKPTIPTVTMRWYFIALFSLPFLALLFLLSLIADHRLMIPVTSTRNLNVSVAATTDTPLSLFIGIITLPDSYERRHFLRGVYHAEKKGLPPSVTVDVKFIFCKLQKPEQHLFVSLEISKFDDIVVLNCTEDMNTGKTYTYFSSLPLILPRRYDYVMKADDDTYLRLPKLTSTLRLLPRTDLYYGFLIPCDRKDPSERGTYMSGMGFAISWDLVEWISTSEIPEKKKVGPEDMMVGEWFAEGNKAKNRVSEKPAMYNFPGTDVESCAHNLIPETVAVHKVKRWDQWRDVLQFFNSTVGIVRPSKLIHSIDQRFLSPGISGERNR